MKIYHLLLAVCLLHGLPAFAQQPDSHFDLYILAGQSNMAGRGYITDEFKNAGDSRVFMLTKDYKWVLAKHPLHFDKQVAAVGPGLAFGIAMANAAADPKVKIGLIACAVGGTAIELWLPGAYDPATKTHPYDDGMLRIKTAMQYGVIKGIIWHQGEANSKPEQVKLYLAQLKELIERFRVLVDNPNLPFIAGELGRFRPEFAGINNELTGLPAMVPYTAIVSTEGLVHRGDTLHFDSSSADELGKRYAKKMLEVQKK